MTLTIINENNRRERIDGVSEIEETEQTIIIRTKRKVIQISKSAILIESIVLEP